MAGQSRQDAGEMYKCDCGFLGMQSWEVKAEAHALGPSSLSGYILTCCMGLRFGETARGTLCSF